MFTFRLQVVKTQHQPVYLRVILYLSLVAAILVNVTHVTPASATIISASSSAFGEAATIVTTSPLASAVTVTSSPLPVVTGTAPAPYSLTQTAASAFLTGVLNTSTLTSTAASNVDDLSGTRSVSASSTVQSLAINILSVLGLTADTVLSSANISGSLGTPTPLAATTITNLRLAGVLIPTASVAPNTVILDTAGVKVTLNEQALTGAGTNNVSLLVNAIDVGLANAAQPIVGDLLHRTNLLNGDIVIGQSKASLSAVADVTSVPEPASLLLFTSSLLSMGLCKVHRHISRWLIRKLHRWTWAGVLKRHDGLSRPVRG